MFVFGGFQGVLLNDVLSFTPGKSKKKKDFNRINDVKKLKVV